MDHYEVLGLNRNANKEEIKQAVRKKAMQFHPDKHMASPKSVRDEATLRYKKAIEAYDVLIDDSKRSVYDLRLRSSGLASSSSANSSSKGYGHGHGSNYTHGGGGDYSFVSKLKMARRFIYARPFLQLVLLQLSIVGAVAGLEKLLKMQDSGKSSEETMDSIEKTKEVKKKR